MTIESMNRDGLDGAQRIAVERRRQVTDERHDERKDAVYRYGELAKAAACYVLLPDQRMLGLSYGMDKPTPILWPWASHWWKPEPDDRVRELEKAGALIAAEIDRILALEGRTENDLLAIHR